jgi:hypothetical protein
MHVSSFPVILPHLMETTSETKLQGLWQNGIHPFLLFFFGCSFNHILLILFPSNQLFDQLKIHNGNPINRLSMIYL